MTSFNQRWVLAGLLMAAAIGAWTAWPDHEDTFSVGGGRVTPIGASSPPAAGMGQRPLKLAVPSAPVQAGPSSTDFISPPPAVVAEAKPVEGDRQRNPGIDPQSLTSHRIESAKALLREVTLSPNPRGGFTVEDVEPGSPYALMGLLRGDRLFSIDTPDTSEVDDTSLESAMMQSEIQIEVYRGSGFVLLRQAL